MLPPSQIIGGGGWGREATNVESTLSLRTFDTSLFFLFILYEYTAICFRHFHRFQQGHGSLRKE